jgi:4-amino-4-deoxy-L-arabinose transferase-like glycosyltransferase
MKKYLTLIIFLIIVLLLLAFSWKPNIIFTDEILFEEASYQMATTGNFLIPQQQGEIWLEKPPLYFWLTALIYQLIPPYPITRRLVTLLSSIATIILTYKLALLFYKKSVARWSMVILAITPLFLYFSKTANLDIPSTFLITASLYTYLKAKKNPKLLFVSAVFFGLAILTRSFLALTPIIVIALDQILISKQKIPIKSLVMALVLVLLISLPWHYYAWKNYPDIFIEKYLNFNLTQHLLTQTPGHQPLSRLKFLTNVLIKFNPLTPLILILLFKKKFLKKPEKFLFAWILASLLPLSLATTRHEWYAIQYLPPFAILASNGLSQLNKYLKSKLKTQTYELVKIFTFSYIIALPIGVFQSLPKETKVITLLKMFIENTPQNTPLYNIDHQYLPNSTLYNPRQTPVISKEEIASLENPTYIYIDNQIQYQAVESNLKSCCRFSAFITYEDASIIDLKPK